MFGAKLQDPATRGLLVVVEHGFRGPLLHISCVSLNPSLFLIFQLYVLFKHDFVGF